MHWCSGSCPCCVSRQSAQKGTAAQGTAQSRLTMRGWPTGALAVAMGLWDARHPRLVQAQYEQSSTGCWEVGRAVHCCWHCCWRWAWRQQWQLPLSAVFRVCRCVWVFLQGFVATALEHFWSSGPGLKDDKQLQAVLDGCDQGRDMRPVARNGPSSPSAAFQDHSNGQQHVCQQMPACYHSMIHEVSHCWYL
jgi:hypothetical protein